MKFIESYENNLVKFRFISKISPFLIAIFIMLEIGDFFTNLQMNPAFFENNQNSVVLSLLFQTLIAILFISRFILLWFKKSKFIWLSQLVWLFSWLTILAYYFVTSKIYYGTVSGNSEFRCYDCIYYDTFLHASTGLTITLIFYLFFSPIQQIIMLTASFLNRK
jgi:hypothetical protein